jgi:hypothetical protein
MNYLPSWYEALRGGSNLRPPKWGLWHLTKEPGIPQKCRSAARRKVYNSFARAARTWETKR